MSWWNDGSLRWILLDFADSPEQKTVTLEFGREVTRRAVPKDAVLQVFSESRQTVVQNRSLQLRFDPQERFPPATRIAYDLGPSWWAPTATGTMQTVRSTSSWWSRAEALRCVVRIRGRATANEGDAKWSQLGSFPIHDYNYK